MNHVLFLTGRFWQTFIYKKIYHFDLLYIVGNNSGFIQRRWSLEADLDAMKEDMAVIQDWQGLFGILCLQVLQIVGWPFLTDSSCKTLVPSKMALFIRAPKGVGPKLNVDVTNMDRKDTAFGSVSIHPLDGILFERHSLA